MNTIQGSKNPMEVDEPPVKGPSLSTLLLKLSPLLGSINFKVAKWGILVLSSFLIMGDFYAYDVPYAIKEQLRIKFHGQIPTNFDYYFNLLYSVYTFPNIFMPFCNGYITDKVRLYW